MEDKGPAIISMSFILLLVWLSNSGKLLALRNVISGAPARSSAGTGSSAPIPSGGSGPPLHGPIGRQESEQALADIERFFQGLNA